MAQDAQLISQAGLVESLASDGLVSVSTGAGQPQKNMELAKFADSLGSSVPLQQNAEQVGITGLYARTSDGKMVELTKESVASVMGKLLYGADTLAGLVSGLTQNLGNSTVTSETVDSAVKTGSYGHGRELFEGGNYGVLLVFNNVAYNYIAQIDISANKNTFYRFGLKNDTGYSWTEWRSDNFGYNTLAELSSGVAEQNSIYNVNRTLNAGESYDTGKSFGLIVFSAPSSGLVGVYIAYAGNVLMVKGSDETLLNSVYEFSRTSSGTVNLKNNSEGQRLINLTIISAL